MTAVYHRDLPPGANCRHNRADPALELWSQIDGDTLFVDASEVLAATGMRLDEYLRCTTEHRAGEVCDPGSRDQDEVKQTGCRAGAQGLAMD